ncbi:MAG: hypothetical protein RLZZ383_1594, partial [Pseudomonadota bacterium]
ADLVADPEGQDVSYVFEADVAGASVSATVEPGATTAAWVVDPALADGDTVCWQVVAVDTTGLASAPSSPWCFVVDLTNEPPSAPTIVTPAYGEVWAQPVELVIRPGIDPEGRAVTHRVALEAPVAADLFVLETGVTDAQLPNLSENTWYTLAVLADDGAATSPWVSTTFLVDSENDPPSAPVLLGPSDGDTVAAGAVGLTLLPGVDVDDWAGTLQHTVVVTSEGAEVASIPATADAVGLRAELVLPAGAYAWYAVADDGVGGVASSSTWTFRVGAAEPPVNDRDPGDPLDDPFALDEGQTGCGCSASGDGTALSALSAASLALLLASRRRTRR